MKSKTKKLYSVLTGDIIKSSKLSLDKHKLLIKVMRTCSKEITIIYPNALKYEPEFFRGDSWQLLLKKPELALSIALFYRTFLKAKMKLSNIDARMAISIGTVDIIQSEFGIGNAYKISGETLDKKGKRRIKFASDLLPSHELIDLIIYNTDLISSKWTSKQSEIILFALQTSNQKEIARRFHITQQAVSQHLESAGWYVISKNLNYFIAAISNLVKQSK
jgi:hypothetical protein